jgi:8-oxo-dGTP pyrophosphatase MutT (NUDIX family)
MQITDTDQENPWKTLSSEPIYENPWISVREDKVINPAGGDGIYGVVHFRNYAIGVIPLDADGYTWLVGQYRYPLEAYSWEIPMGGAAFDGTPLEGGKRELKEETGITAARWTELMKLHTSNSVTDEVGYVFVATELTQGTSTPEDTEQLKVRHLPFSEALDMVLANTITDGISVAAILRLHAALNSGEIAL